MIQKFTFGTPETLVPSAFCPGFSYTETPGAVSYPAERFSFAVTPGGCTLSFPLEDDCKIFGFGLQLKQLEHRGHFLRLATNADPATANGESHAPVPFFVTNKGYGMYFDTARYAEFACGRQKNPAFRTRPAMTSSADAPDVQGLQDVKDSTEALYAARPETSASMEVRIPTAAGLDVYVIEGSSITDIVSQYNMLAGGGPVVDDTAFGMLYRCCGSWDAEQVKQTVSYFEENDIPCSTIGLEPGWHTHAYSCSYRWSSRYPDPDAFLTFLHAHHLQVNLWEHAFTHPTAPFHDAIAPYAADTLVWEGLVPDFATPEARRIFADYHRTALVEHGVDAFKLDECDGSDNTGGWSFPPSTRFPSGLDGEQYHSLFGALYAQTIMEALGGRHSLNSIRQMGALGASYPFVLYSDLYDHRDFIRGVVTAGFSGLLWAPEFRSASSREDCIRRMQVIVFSAQCLVNAWNYDGIPWVVHDCENEVRELLHLRKRLWPRLRKAFDAYHETGRPPIRALVMDYTDDARTYTIDDEYLFCDDLLVAPIASGRGDERDVYLPVASRWADFFTGEEIILPEDGRLHVKTAGIPVYRRLD